MLICRADSGFPDGKQLPGNDVPSERLHLRKVELRTPRGRARNLMQLASETRDHEQKISSSIYVALIDSLFQNPAPLFAGAVLVAIAAVMTALKTQENLLWPCASFLMGSGVARGLDMHRYNRRNFFRTADEAARWEVRYQIGAMIYAVALGTWCSVALLSSNDAVAHMICLSVTTGYVAAGAGRTYGRPWIFHVQIALACGPTAIALALHGTPYYIGMACVSAVFFLALKQISTDLQRIFVQALVAREREAALASQFDTALNNMPHGLCMFRADGRLAVMNHRFSEMMNLSDDLVQRGASAHDILAACISVGSISAPNGKMLLAAISFCAPSPTGCVTCCARRISWRGSAATNSWCFSRTSNRARMRPILPGASSTI